MVKILLYFLKYYFSKERVPPAVEGLSYVDAVVSVPGGHRGAGDGLGSFCERDAGVAPAGGRRWLRDEAPGERLWPHSKASPLHRSTRARGGTGRDEARSGPDSSGLGHSRPFEAALILLQGVFGVHLSCCDPSLVPPPPESEAGREGAPPLRHVTPSTPSRKSPWDLGPFRVGPPPQAL